MNEFETFHNQAELSIDHLIAIRLENTIIVLLMKLYKLAFIYFFYLKRSEWDLFISNSTKAESIPITWIEPNSTPNEEWSQFLKLSN